MRNKIDDMVKSISKKYSKSDLKKTVASKLPSRESEIKERNEASRRSGMEITARHKHESKMAKKTGNAKEWRQKNYEGYKQATRRFSKGEM